MKFISVVFLLFTCGAVAAEQRSNEEMVQQGREIVNKHPEQRSNDEMVQQGREIVKKYSDQLNTTSNVLPSLNAAEDSPLLMQHRALPSEQKEFMDLVLGRKKYGQVEVKKRTELIIFVSFSMPGDDLIKYSRQAAEYGAVVVMRGMDGNSLEKTKMSILAVNPVGVEWDIAPATFKKFKVEKVPSIVLADTTMSNPVEDGCAKEGDYLRVDGNVSLHQALVLMRQYGDNKRLVDSAKTYLEIENN
jgi:type-F conjugative transfer system pilin assembly protein TrbC